jgi:hypothetical protein
LNEKAANRTCAAALACERYRLKHGTWPKGWDQLAPAFLPQVLIDPYTGTPLKLKPLDDGLIVYSVGFDGKDDGGDVLPSEGHFAFDLGIHLWYPDQRRKPPKKMEGP